jgi:nucleoside-diphosphate-sugar epimerase
MKNILVTGGTIFVSKFVAQYFSSKKFCDEYQVYVLNRNNHLQVENVILINSSRQNLGSKLEQFNFDIIIDITSYTKEDVKSILDSLGSSKEKIEKYILLSSSAVYPETLDLPFKETDELGKNIFWKDYGINKIEAEKYLQENFSNYFILRPPYLYGPENNVYREAFVFDCAENDRKFFIPENENMKLQFFYIEDLCKVIENILIKNPSQKIFNLGNENTISILDWVKLCYQVVGKNLEVVNVSKEIPQRNYFCFYDYEYYLDVTKQKSILENTTSLKDGLEKSYQWYKNNKEKVNRKNYFEFIDNELI